MKFPWYAHNIEDYDRKTAHLSIIQDGAYRRLLDHYYRTGGPLEANASGLLRVCRAVDEAEREAVLWVLGKFFVERDGYYYNDRADQEISKRVALSEKRAAAGQKGGTQPKTKRPAKAPANGEASGKQLLSNSSHTLHTQSKIDSSEEKNLSLVGAGPEEAAAPTVRKLYSAEFEEFWLAYPRTPNMSKPKAFERWQRLMKSGLLAAQPKMLIAVAGYRKFLADQSKNRKDPYPAAHAAVWLNERRYEGFLEALATPIGATVPTGPGWEQAYPETWGKIREAFRQQHGSDTLWNNLFSGVRPASETELLCSNPNERDVLKAKFGEDGEKLMAIIKAPVKFTYERPTARH